MCIFTMYATSHSPSAPKEVRSETGAPSADAGFRYFGPRAYSIRSVDGNNNDNAISLRSRDRVSQWVDQDGGGNQTRTISEYRVPQHPSSRRFHERRSESGSELQKVKALACRAGVPAPGCAEKTHEGEDPPSDVSTLASLIHLAIWVLAVHSGHLSPATTFPFSPRLLLSPAGTAAAVAYIVYSVSSVLAASADSG